MPHCYDNSLLWRALMILIALCFMYFYLYTHLLKGIQTTGVYRVVEGDLLAIWKTNIGSMEYHLKIKEKYPEISASNSNGMASAEDTEANAMKKIVLKEKIINKESLPLLTLFTSWTDNSEKYLIHNLTVYNWLSLRPYVVPVIFTNDAEVADECRRMGWEVFPVMVAAADGIPVLKYMYRDVMEAFNTTFYAYSNSDILYTDSLVDTLVALLNSNFNLQAPILLIGKRTNVNFVKEKEISSWKNLKTLAKSRGKLFFDDADDYFITTRLYPWKDIAEVVIGRVAYDNWLVWYARKQKQVVIDATNTLLAVHQTTAAGNFEGRGNKNGQYNRNLLTKLYEGIKYKAGSVGCAEKYTKYDAVGNIVIVSRTVHKQCFILYAV